MSKKVVIYARYSTDQQNPASIETQIDLATAFVTQHGWTLHNAYVNAGVSGASFETRPGLQAVLREAQTGAFEVLLCLTLSVGKPCGTAAVRARGSVGRPRSLIYPSRRRRKASEFIQTSEPFRLGCHAVSGGPQRDNLELDCASRVCARTKSQPCTRRCKH